MSRPLVDLDADEGTATKSGHRAVTRTSRWQKVVGVVGLLVVLWVGGDLYGVVTSGGEDPPGRPAGGPPAGQPHDPSQFKH